jgi:hypothetical protein
MLSQRKRPVGVTLLAIVFLWIGCFGTLIFPILALTGSTSELWHLILGPVIHSGTWMKALSGVLNSVWFLFYVAYAVIGFGLWRLRDRARKTVLGLSIFGIAASAVVAVLLVRSFMYGLVVFGAALVEFGWIAWYLVRPRVRYAFGAWNRYAPTGEWIEPPGLSKRGKLGIALLCGVDLRFLLCSALPCDQLRGEIFSGLQNGIGCRARLTLRSKGGGIADKTRPG